MRLFILAMALAISACSMTPELVRPDVRIAPGYPGYSDASDTSSVGSLSWQTMFGDPRLQALIDTALRHNTDIRAAVLNVEAAKAMYGIQRSEQFPAMSVNAGVSRERTRSPSAEPVRQTQLATGIGVPAFELDLWGRARSLSDAAFARYTATEEGRRAAQLSMVAAVADAYFAERLAEEQEALALETLHNWTDQRDLTLQLKRALQGNAIDVAQAEAQMARAQVEAAAHSRALSQTRNALALLVGAPLESLTLPAPMPLDRQPVRSQLPPGLPSDLLILRPDIRQAEQTLRAANADIGAARAAFFPRVSLTATLGFASPELDGLFRGSNRVWSFAPSVSQQLFDAGRLRAELRLSELRKSIAVVEYERAVQTAFREVADGLAGTATYSGQIQALERVVAEEQRRETLAGQRYRAGLDGRLEWLDAQRALFAARQELLALRRDALGNAAMLYKALGGGVINLVTPPH